MKKNIVILLGCMGIIILLLTGCKTKTTVYDEGTNTLWSQFVILESRTDGLGDLYIAYDKNTKVMYYVWYGYYKGAISPIYNADGSVKVYE